MRIVWLVALTVCSAACSTANGGGTTQTNDSTAATDTGGDTSSDSGTASDSALGGGQDAGTTDVTNNDTASPPADTGGATADTGSATADTGGATGDATKAAITFGTIYNKVIKTSGCSAGYCHGGGAGEMLLTDEATSYKSLVGPNAESPVCGLTKRVVPGKPDESILWLRVRPTALDGLKACGEKMPKGTDGLSDELAALVKAWIEAGAAK